MSATPLRWTGIARLGLVQAAIGAIAVLATSTLNRVMVVELALPAMLPGALVALHHTMQVLRPRLGHGLDVGGRRTPWIVGSIAVLALGAVLAAMATAMMATHFWPGLVLAIAAFMLIGAGYGTSCTALLVLFAARVDPGRRAAAATVLWMMMIGGMIATGASAGYTLDPFSPARLVAVATAIAAAAVALAVVAVWGVEGAGAAPPSAAADAPARTSFLVALGQIWAEPPVRRFAIFVFVSMLALGAQELIIDPFAALVFGLTPGGTTRLSGVQQSGVLLGMLLAGCASGRFGSLSAWTIGGCLATATALAGLASVALAGSLWSLRPMVFTLGAADGVYIVAVSGSMMALVGIGRSSREGTRMGLWTAAQAIAFALGGFVTTLGSDVARAVIGRPGSAYALLFAADATLFIVSAMIAARIGRSAQAARGPDDDDVMPRAALEHG